MNSTAPSPAVSSTMEDSALKRRVALRSMLAAACMTALKLAAGLISGSLGILSDAAHSGARPGGIRDYLFLRSRL